MITYTPEQKSTVTLKTIMKKITKKYRRKIYNSIFLLAGAFLGLISMVMGAGFFALILILPCGFCGIQDLCQGIKGLRNTNAKPMYIITDVCRDKCDWNSDPPSKEICFNNNVKWDTYESNTRIKIQGTRMDIFAVTNIGDEFYIVFFEGEQNPELCISRRFFELDASNFRTENGRIIPKK